MKKTVALLIAFIVMTCFTACHISDVTDQLKNAVQMEDENVLLVKKARPEDYPDKTWEQAFESFFALPAWTYFKGTSEGPDDNEDGIPDYTENNIDVVEFTGYCTYMDEEVKARIQFVLNKLNGTFKAEYLSFNDVPQTKLMLALLIEKAFESNGPATDKELEEFFNEKEQETSAVTTTITTTITTTTTSATTTTTTEITEPPTEKILQMGVVVLNDGYLNVRDVPSMLGNVISKLYNGDVVIIEESEGNWYKISLGNTYGYCSKDFVSVYSDY